MHFTIHRLNQSYWASNIPVLILKKPVKISDIWFNLWFCISNLA